MEKCRGSGEGEEDGELDICLRRVRASTDTRLSSDSPLEVGGRPHCRIA